MRRLCLSGFRLVALFCSVRHVDVIDVDDVDNVALPLTRERVLSKYSTMSKQWTPSYSRSESPSIAESTK